MQFIVNCTQRHPITSTNSLLSIDQSRWPNNSWGRGLGVFTKDILDCPVRNYQDTTDLIKKVSNIDMSSHREKIDEE